ncbi:MAG: DUF1127 domain-containing protein [Pseudomonadota bacterium]
MTTLDIFLTRYHRIFAAPKLLRRAFLAYQVARERRELADLDAHMLKDVGLSSDDVRVEANRSVWDLPSQRL